MQVGLERLPFPPFYVKPFSVGHLWGCALYFQISRVFPESRRKKSKLVLWCSLSRREGCVVGREELLGSESWVGKSSLRF